VTGMIIDGVIYHQPCYTRYGNYPYCEEMRQGAYSTTKSMGAAIALLRLAQKYGDYVFDLYIKDYVAVTAEHDGWSNVTFADALNMATGIGDNSPNQSSNDIFADENTAKMERWQKADTNAEKLEIVFSYGNYSWGPGEVFRYNSTHTYILAAAMDAFYKSIEGSDSNLWDMVTHEVLEPIGIKHAPMIHTVEDDGSMGIPVLYVGLFPTMDDVAKISTLYQNHGVHNGEQLLHSIKTQEALYRADKQGLPSFWANNGYGDSQYLYSFWSEPLLKDGCFFQVPYMSGFGGNIVALLPHGVTAFRFADASEYSATDMVRAAASIGTICQ